MEEKDYKGNSTMHPFKAEGYVNTNTTEFSNAGRIGHQRRPPQKKPAENTRFMRATRGAPSINRPDLNR